MPVRTMARFAAAPLVAGLVLTMASLPVAAQGTPSAWQVVGDGPTLSALTAGALAADSSGSVVLVGFSGSPAPPKGNKPLDATAHAWSSPDGVTWSEATLDGAEGALSRSVSAGPSGYVAVGLGPGGGRIWHSPSGEAWTDVSGDSTAKGNIYDVAGGPAGYVAVGLTTTGKGKKLKSVPTAWTSVDGLDWTSAPIADVVGVGVNVAAAPDGGLLAAVYQPQRKGPTKKGTFQFLPPGLAFYQSADGTTWTPAAASPAVDASQLRQWDLAFAGGQYRFTAEPAPDATGGPDGHYASPDGSVWTPVPQLRGLNGATGALGDGVVALGDAAIEVSPDGEAWQWSAEDVLAGSHTRSLVGLSDGRVIATGPVPKGSGEGYILYMGSAPTDGVELPSDCVAADVVAQLMASDLFELPAPERARIAASLAAYVPAEGEFLARQAIVTALRSGESLDQTWMLGILTGEVAIPTCP